MFKVDFEKAYDSVDLNYLDSVMSNMNFPTLCVSGYQNVWVRQQRRFLSMAALRMSSR